MTWLAVLGAVLAIGVVLRTSMELGDRRGRFVSAVTHELRTPLTTFCLYTEMLADGMVPDEPRRAQYLGTLKGESRRLAGIVENVLDYARLGGARRAEAHPSLSVADLMDQFRPALERSAALGRMELHEDLGDVAGVRVNTDVRTVERILLNLTDNAGKYASEAADRRLHITARPEQTRRGLSVVITVRDHGPGVPRRERRRIFEPFHRAHRDADGPKSGLGLGLALARGLARSLGGDLVLEWGGQSGAAFSLSIPASAKP
jgi:signal transduction histidine kinase